MDSTGSDAGRRERNGRRKKGSEVREQAFEVATDSLNGWWRSETRVEWSAQEEISGCQDVGDSLVSGTKAENSVIW